MATIALLFHIVTQGERRGGPIAEMSSHVARTVLKFLTEESKSAMISNTTRSCKDLGVRTLGVAMRPREGGDDEPPTEDDVREARCHIPSETQATSSRLHGPHRITLVPVARRSRPHRGPPSCTPYPRYRRAWRSLTRSCAKPLFTLRGRPGTRVDTPRQMPPGSLKGQASTPAERECAGSFHVPGGCNRRSHLACLAGVT